MKQLRAHQQLHLTVLQPIRFGFIFLLLVLSVPLRIRAHFVVSRYENAACTFPILIQHEINRWDYFTFKSDYCRSATAPAQLVSSACLCHLEIPHASIKTKPKYESAKHGERISNAFLFHFFKHRNETTPHQSFYAGSYFFHENINKS